MKTVTCPACQKTLDGYGDINKTDMLPIFNDHLLECMEDVNAKLAAAQTDLNFMWKWIERGAFCASTTPKGAINILSYYDSAPWYKNREQWDTSHKSYNEEINDRISDREKLKLAEQALEQIAASSDLDYSLKDDRVFVKPSNCQIAEAALAMLGGALAEMG